MKDVIISVLLGAACFSFAYVWHLKYRIDRLNKNYKELLGSVRVLSQQIEKTIAVDSLQNDILIKMASVHAKKEISQQYDLEKTRVSD